MSEALRPGNVAVITGAASGIGAAMARMCALRYSMEVVLLDVDDVALSKTASSLSSETMETVLDIPMDVTNLSHWEAVREQVWQELGGCHFLFLNAGIGSGGSVLKNPDEWQTVFNVNVFGVLYGMQVMVPDMIQQGATAVVATTASRVAITNPPSGGNAYNASKAAVVKIAESLEHHLRNLPNCLVESRLLLPGMTKTKILYNTVRRNQGEAVARDLGPAKLSMPEISASPDKIAETLLDSIVTRGPFYVVGEDGDMDANQYNHAVQWSAEDLIHRRPPLSRWLEPYRSEFLAKSKL